jgi:CBS domain-containing protein
MKVPDQVQSSCGSDAPVMLYAADAVITMPGDSTLSAAAQELCDDAIGLVVIGTPGHPTGVLSERDLVRAVASSLDPATTPAVEVASSSIVWCDRSATVHEAAELMMGHYVRHVLLEEEGRLVGIVSARDLLGAYTMSRE